ncbi:MAG TPA: D-glycero-beta-D-manno-heptose 1-phosphate adenylyltransferase, partial [Desulfobacterales bacterium]|nr:D-glycero-beta-D-manno-heptose 1-phosphate adenylyltransferase [Desulfobacterales bacterium]
MDINKKIIELKDIKAKVAEIKESGKKIVFTNGCFDILHVGHVRYLA